MNEIDIIRSISFLIIISAVVVFFKLVLMNFRAWYGRYNVGTVGIPARLAWFLQEIPALLIPLVLLMIDDSKQPKQLENILTLAMYFIHYSQRSLIYPFLIRGGKPSPIYIVILATIFCTVNGYTQIRYHWHYASYKDDPAWIRCLTIFGLMIFTIGMMINVRSDHILRSLRKPGETGYRIPHGGMFEYVSGANFFGEIMEWMGYAICARSLTSFAFALFTVANIGPRAWHHHQFYKQNFKDYPTNRKALIPFLI